VFANGRNTGEWGLELFISPTQSLYLIVICSLVCLFLIGVWIVILHCQEKQEDRKKREQHFDFF
jgi:Sec-independent protein secretion pathway component TatC